MSSRVRALAALGAIVVTASAHWRHRRARAPRSASTNGKRGPAPFRPATTAARNPSSTPRPPGTRPSASPTSSFNTDVLGFPEGNVRDVRVDLPPGLSVNPQATPQCTEAELQGPGPALCIAKGAQVGDSPGDRGQPARPRGPGPGAGLQHRPQTGRARRVRLPGRPARDRRPLGLPRGHGPLGERLPRGLHDPGDPQRRSAGRATGSSSRVAPGTAASSPSAATAAARPPPASPSTPTSPPTACTTTPLRFSRSKPIQPTGCGNVPFNPGIAVDPGTARTDSPTGAAVDATVPFEPSKEIGQANVKRAEVTLPQGHGAEPRRRTQPQSLHRRPVRQGDRARGREQVRRPGRCAPAADRLPRRLEDRHRLDPDPGAAGELVAGHRLPRRAAQPRPDLGQACTGSSSTPSRPATASTCG